MTRCGSRCARPGWRANDEPGLWSEHADGRGLLRLHSGDAESGPIYTGITNDLHRRVFEHKTHAIKGFTARFNVDRLVYVEVFDDPESAIAREKRLKRWRRQWKVALIERDNPEWRDLAEEFVP
jgi:putative endonuclease